LYFYLGPHLSLRARPRRRWRRGMGAVAPATGRCTRCARAELVGSVVSIGGGRQGRGREGRERNTLCLCPLLLVFPCFAFETTPLTCCRLRHASQQRTSGWLMVGVLLGFQVQAARLMADLFWLRKRAPSTA